MRIELIIMFVVGMVLIGVGLLIWKKERISCLHSYHYTYVKEQDKSAFASLTGKGVMTIGVGCVSCGALNYVELVVGGWVLFCVSFFCGLGLIIKAQKKYNNGLF